MDDGTQSFSEVKTELLDKIDAVDRKVDAVDRKVDAVDRKVDETRVELTSLITATATSLEHRIDRKLDGMEQRLTRVAERSAEKAADRAVHRVLGAVYERSQQDAGVRDDRIDSLERRLDAHITNERIHLDDGQ